MVRSDDDAARELEERVRARLFERVPSHFFPYVAGSARPRDATLEAADRYLVESWVAREARALGPEPVAAAIAAARIVRRLVATERDLPGLTAATSFDDPASLVARAFATLLVGFASAEGTALVVLRLLRASGHRADLFATGAVTDAPEHMLVLVSSSGKGAFVDAWSDVAVLWVDGFDVARAARGGSFPEERAPRIDGPLAGVPEYSSLSAPGGLRQRGLPPRDAFLRGRLVSSYVEGPDLPSLRAGAEAFLAEEREADRGATEIWRRYLELRARDLDGDLDDPSASYAELLDDARLKGATRRLVRAHHERARKSGDSDAKRVPARRKESTPAPDLTARMRMGDPSTWVRWDPQPIDEAAMVDAWTAVFENRGRPGVPEMVRAYTHFAYCTASCNFCMYWHEVPKHESRYARYVNYLVSRVESHRARFGRQPLDAAYFGGGTPTATPHDELSRYFSAFTGAFDVRGELSVEGHPATTTEETIRMLAGYGVNRLSMGIQSLEHDVLVRITRRNAPLDHVKGVIAAARSRAMVVNLDLVLGLPGQSMEAFRSDVLRLTELEPDYVTAYLYEPATRLPERPPDDMTFERAFDAELRARMRDNGYEIADPMGPSRRSLRLRRVRGSREFDAGTTYVQFDEQPSHLVALGPGAFGHVFGKYRYREVTAMASLEAETPRFHGTTMSPVDECRTIVLDALARGRSFDVDRIATTTGVDVRAAFRDAFAYAEGRGIFRAHGSVVDVADAEGREELIDRLVPEAPTAPSRPFEEGAAELALVALRRSEVDTQVDRAALLEFLDVLEVPPAGHQICKNVWVGRASPTSIAFHVGAPKAQPLELFVTSPIGGRAKFLSTDRFAIAFRSAGGADASELERRFLGWLAKRIAAIESRARS